MALNTIGFVADVLGIVGFTQSLIPGREAMGATVRIKAGLGDDESTSLGGNIAAVYGFDINNDFLGASGGGSLGDGGVLDLVIDQATPGKQADFVSVSNGDDGICIAWIAVSQFDDSGTGAWTGDIGKGCGADWYVGNQNAGTLPDGTAYRPNCAWLDGNHNNDIAEASLKFRTLAYGASAVDTVNSGRQCTSTIFGPDTGPIPGAPAKRTPRARLPWMERRLIVSSFPAHSAAELCNSTTSRGPDFVGPDGKFCDMGTKTLYPLCSVEEVDGCVEVNPVKREVIRQSTVARRSVQTVQKSYKTVTQWD